MTDKRKNTVIPNSYQKPNLFVDELMCLLPPACNLLLDVACRQILGWEEHRGTRRDRISLSQFQAFTGLSLNTIRTHLDILHGANILTPDGRPNLQGQEYELNLGQLGEYRLDYLRGLPRRHGDISAAASALKASRLQVELPIDGGTGVSNFDIAVGGYQNLTPSNDCKAPLSTIAMESYQSVQTPNPKPINITNDSIWLEVLAQLKLELTPSTFETWLPSTRLLAVADGRYLIGAPNQYTADWLTHRLTASIARAIRTLTGQSASVEFVVKESVDA